MPQELIVNKVSEQTDRWNFPSATGLAFCVNKSSFGSRYQTTVDAIKSAAAAWEAVANIHFGHISADDLNCTNNTTDVIFDVRQVSGQPFLARSFSPSFTRSNREILIDSSSFGNIQPITLTGILRHELGHVLGFRHEHTRPESGACFEDAEWFTLTTYDSNSVMHYPQCNGTNTGDLALSSLDKTGASLLYPRFYGVDILWRASDGTVAIWLMDSGPSYPGKPGSEWAIQGIGDFDGNGKSDILWRATDKTLAIWFMNGGNIVAQAFPTARPGFEWTIQGIGDFDHDERSDILWRANDGTLAIWFMNGGNIAAQAFPTVRPGFEWTIQGVGDFDGNGRSDILWRADDGTLAIWFMNGGNIVAQAFPTVRPGFEWTIQGVGDFDHDGRSDILWRANDRTLAIWFMNGSNIVAQAFPTIRPGFEWTIQGVGDFDHDGKSDILWRANDGTLAIWFMNGGNIASQNFPGAPGLEWTIQGVGTFN